MKISNFTEQYKERSRQLNTMLSASAKMCQNQQAALLLRNNSAQACHDEQAVTRQRCIHHACPKQCR
jgi:hypothetical protein